jgi:ribosomal protein S12 methylthiotransferase
VEEWTNPAPEAGRREPAPAGAEGPSARRQPAESIVHSSTPPLVHSAVRGRLPNLLPDLLGALLRETGIPWLRLFYLYPSGIDRRLVECIAGEPRIVRYVDMPIQHGADPVLERMRRPERQATIRERVRWLRESIPDVALRSTVIVGFPGERDEDFQVMLELLEELRFDHLGAFAYSVEEGTPAAAMPGQVPEALRRERLERVLDLQRVIALERNEARIGRTTGILVERVGGRGGRAAPGSAVGRAPWQAPELDGIVTLRGPGRPERRPAGAVAPLRPGTFVQARIVEATEDDLVAQIVD